MMASASPSPSLFPLTTTITSDPGILCFHHCNVKVFCFTLPHTCPHCNAQLNAAATEVDDDDNHNDDAPLEGTKVPAMDTRLLPFRLPYPFVRATQYPCAIVLRPSTGDFLNDYNNATDLHIAVTTSVGDIVEFDRDGLQRHRRDGNPHEWWQSLLVGDVPDNWHDYWDEVLHEICGQSSRWSIASYEESSHNCYTFVLAFLQALGHAQLSEAARSKTSFCEKHIVPRTTTAGKYISLYRKLRASGVHVQRPTKQHRAQTNATKTTAGDSENVQQQNKMMPMGGNGNSIIMPRNRTRKTLCTIEE